MEKSPLVFCRISNDSELVPEGRLNLGPEHDAFTPKLNRPSGTKLLLDWAMSTYHYLFYKTLVRPVHATLTGNFVGKGEPGLAYSEDFVLQDENSLMILNYHQPLLFWNLIFGFFMVEQDQGKQVYFLSTSLS